MERGQVYLTSALLPDRASGTGLAPRDKWVVVLQGGPQFARATDVAVAIASTRRSTLGVRPFEVLVGPQHGFRHESIIDGRWVYTLLKSDVEAGTLKTTLDAATMQEVSEAIAIGLQLV